MKIIFRVHAIHRMFERSITTAEIRTALANGEIIEKYPEDTPYPSRLVLGWRGSRPLHIVLADNAENNEWIIVTVYQPDPEQWDTGFKRRKQ